ncbi:iron(III) transport system ATP-binding protein [Catalinimonas alkaloidigena]|uniref:Iron(III) transport system ATP-binding protein n=1 Tax=Catalinimonas alkaloidigena TaxID=1075417 RepID=A0A1G9RJ25_9BACT|nr:ABC transporter ATP-binding protein [Catalinimonas alkaloidigena]SDM23329.1 iron(III) transport system ATP-binding protein [Catalinimonas alkaloidigena]
MLRVQSLSRHYPEQTSAAVQQVSLQLEPGEIHALTGSSGSGKTTLLRLIAGLEDPDAGEIWLGEERIKAPSQQLVPGHADIRLVAQDYQLDPNLTVYDNLKARMRVYTQAYQQERITELLQFVHLWAKRDRYPRELSGGEQQRLALVRALADEPTLLLLDEPFSNLDRLLHRELRHQLFEMLHQEQITTLVVTHDPADALSLADRISILQAGQVIQTGAPQEIYTQPRTAYVARFFGLANLIEGKALTQHFSIDAEPTGVYCVRPEQLELTTADAPRANAQIRQVRFLGGQQEIEVVVGEELITLLVSADTWRSGQDVLVSLKSKAVHRLTEVHISQKIRRKDDFF